MEAKSVSHPRVHYTYNSEDAKCSYQSGTDGRPTISATISNNATLITQNGSTARLVIVGLTPFHDQLKSAEWVQCINSLETRGPVYSCMNLWRIICQFNNLKDLYIHIDGQNVPVDQNLSLQLPQEMEFNATVSNLKIIADWQSFRSQNPESKAWMLAFSLFSLKMAAKCSQLCTFHFEFPDDEDDKIIRAVRDLLRELNLDSIVRIHVLLDEKVSCYYPPAADDLHGGAPPALPVGSGVPQNIPIDESQDWNQLPTSFEQMKP